VPNERRLIYGALAIVIGCVFAFAALDERIYPLTLHVPRMLRTAVHSLHPSAFPVLSGVRDMFIDEGWSGNLLIRKFYSIVAFTIVGLFVALSRRNEPPVRRFLVTVTCTAGLSLAIEILQRFAGSTESVASNLLDVACGAAGGALGLLLQVSHVRLAAIVAPRL
jgi:hypothetical protein